jgi:hypothetical protein
LQIVSADASPPAETPESVSCIGAAAPRAGESWTGMTGSVDGTLYASSAACGSRSTLYTIDPNSGTPTEVGEITNASCVIDIAADALGDMYGFDIAGDVLLSIDPATGAGTVIGSLGFDANYAQGMDFEESTGVLYLAAYNNTSSQGELRIADLNTGNTVLVGSFPGGAETDGLAFPSGGVSDVPWLSEDPITSTLPALFGMPVTVTFDAGVTEITQPGHYYAQLKIAHDTPYVVNNVSVTMTVTAPLTWGKLMGTVSSMGHCDAVPQALSDADVILEGADTYTVTTGADGGYAHWMPAGLYTATVSYSNHITATAAVTVTAQATVTLDLGLRLLQPCATATPVSMTVSVDIDDTLTRPLTLINGGAVSYTFSITETCTAGAAGCPTTMAPQGGSGSRGLGKGQRNNPEAESQKNQ